MSSIFENPSYARQELNDCIGPGLPGGKLHPSKGNDDELVKFLTDALDCTVSYRVK